eukprot:TRINITY_DN26961_c0_g1_i1.p1 TRINITY_DN26961_c0_g1~~TRINITY_DN26961_c0_g1_i1.p1  ORF type:complete len:426 (+),score=67.77 TRINITY_DN26961_c0_g1_i1:60-1337(+)
MLLAQVIVQQELAHSITTYLLPQDLHAFARVSKFCREPAKSLFAELDWLVYVFGDAQDDSEDGNRFACYSVSADKWAAHVPQLPYPCSSGVGVAVQGHVYFVGIDDASADHCTPIFVAYDRQRNAWVNLSALPHRFFNIFPIQAVALGDYLYVLGDGIARYRSGGAWEHLPRWPSDCDQFKMLAAGGALYLIGADGPCMRLSDGLHASQSIFDRYDPATGAWTKLELSDAELQRALQDEPSIVATSHGIFVSYSKRDICLDYRNGSAHLHGYCTHACWVYSFESQDWLRGRHKPTPEHGLVVPLGNVCLAFGFGAQGETTMEGYDIGVCGLGTWALHQPADCFGYHSMYAPLGNQKSLLGVGGRRASGGEDHAERVDLFTRASGRGGTWTWKSCAPLRNISGIDILCTCVVPSFTRISDLAWCSD